MSTTNYPTITLRVRGFAASTLETVGDLAAEMLRHGDEDAGQFALLAAAWNGSSLRFSRERSVAGDISCALSKLADGEAELADELRDDPEAASMARAAAKGLVTLCLAASDAIIYAPEVTP